MALRAQWQGASASARWGLVLGGMLVLAATVALAVWALRSDDGVLFRRLEAADAATLTRELDRMKVPYRLEDEGATILVDGAKVHQTRLRLMGRDLPLHGAVGFELFNDADLGMTEFAQRVNYLRALQGELTRTIVSLAEVRSARVHLALPEEGLFRRERARPKASVTLSLREGRSLRREQVHGIQRLVAAAVPGVEPRDVTLVSDQGVALTDEGADTDGASSSHRLAVKREVEVYLADKANAVLTGAFGAGRALASVDVTLDMRQVRLTTEDVTGPQTAAPGEITTGVVVRERETVREAPRNVSAVPASPEGASIAPTHREVEYQVGRRVEQVISGPGSIVRIQAVGVVREPLDAAGVEQVRALIGHAVGASRERGDTVHVLPMANAVTSTTRDSAGLGGDSRHASDASAVVSPGFIGGLAAGNGAPVGNADRPEASLRWLPAWLALLAFTVAAVLVWKARRVRPQARLPDRDEALSTIRTWLDSDADTSASRGRQ